MYMTPSASPVACAGYYGSCDVGEAGAGLVVGGVAVITDERPDVGGNRAGDSVAASRVIKEGEEGC